jgi:hypothetical protein
MLKKQRKSAFSGAQGGGAFELGPDYYIMHYYSLSGKNGNRHYARGDIGSCGLHLVCPVFGPSGGNAVYTIRTPVLLLQMNWPLGTVRCHPTK